MSYPPADALLRGLRRSRDEPQLTQALAAICQADAVFAAAFLEHICNMASGKHFEIPDTVEVTAEEKAVAGRFDLRFRAGSEWDVIVELKIGAGYGHDWLDRYRRSLSAAENAYVVAVTRDVPWGEPVSDPGRRWLGAARWRDLLPGMRKLPVKDDLLGRQWLLFLDLLEQEGSMGFTRPDATLFDVFAQASLATAHMRDFLRVLEQPLLAALRDSVGKDNGGADLYWPRGGKFAYARWGRLDIPFRVPGDAARGRVRAGLIGWGAQTAFFVQPVPDQRWDRRVFTPAAQQAVDALTAGEFEPKYMRAYLTLDRERIEDDLEVRVVSWCSERFSELVASGLIALPLEALGDAPPPEEEGTVLEGDVPER